VYYGAEVLDVLDRAVSPPRIDGAFTLEANAGTWADGAAIEEPHHYSTNINLQRSTWYTFNPSDKGYGELITVFGNGSSGGAPLIQLSNLGPTSQYAYHGGTKFPPGGISFSGVPSPPPQSGAFNYLISSLFAPDPVGSNAIQIGCPTSGCPDANYWYYALNLAGNGGNGYLAWTPSTRTWSWTQSATLNTTYMDMYQNYLLRPTIQSFTNGTAASLAFNLVDSGGVTHIFTLQTPTTSATNYTAILPQATGTLPVTIASGTTALRTASIAATNCDLGNFTVATGTATTDKVIWNFNAAPVAGYLSGLTIYPYVNTNAVGFYVCNPTGTAQTPAAATLNWSVIR
jgi:hypothetical protein